MRNPSAKVRDRSASRVATHKRELPCAPERRGGPTARLVPLPNKAHPQSKKSTASHQEWRKAPRRESHAARTRSVSRKFNFGTFTCSSEARVPGTLSELRGYMSQYRCTHPSLPEERVVGLSSPNKAHPQSKSSPLPGVRETKNGVKTKRGNSYAGNRFHTPQIPEMARVL